MKPKKVTDITSAQMRSSFTKMLEKSKSMELNAAIVMFREIVKSDPEFVDARNRLRELEMQALPEVKSFKALISNLKFNFIFLILKIFSGKNVIALLGCCEDALSVNPGNVSAWQKMATVASANDGAFIAVEALEFARKLKPKDKNIAVALADAYVQNCEAEKAVMVYQELLRNNPGNAKIKAGLKAATVAISTQSSNDDIEDEDNIDNSKSENERKKEEALLQQIMDGTIRDEAQAQLVIEKLTAVVKENNSLDAHRKLAEAYKVAKDYDTAISHLNVVAQSLGTLDAKLDKDIERLYVLKYDANIAEVTAHPEKYENAEEIIQQLNDEKIAFKIERARVRSNQFINDIHLHYELALEYYNAGYLEEAYREFEISQKNAQHKGNALYYMARILLVDGDVDKAMPLLQKAYETLGIKERNFKPAAYYLGILYENEGNSDKAYELFSEIYQIAPNFKDVAERIKK